MLWTWAIVSNFDQNFFSDGKDIMFGNLSWPKEFETSFNASGPGWKPYYYKLETVLFAVRTQSQSHEDYCANAKSFGVESVRPPSRKALLEYLNGGE